MKLTTIEKEINKIQHGSTIMIGGFMGIGAPHSLINALVESGTVNLTIISNDTDSEGKGVGKLVTSNQMIKLVTSHIGLNPETGRKLSNGELEVELVPQGTLAERIRAKAAGLGGFLTPTGIGTIVENGKRKLDVDGKDYLLETPLGADFALIRAYKADESGNLVFRGSSRNFNPIMATSADYVIAEVEEYVRVGEISIDEVMLPGIFVDAIVRAGDKDDR